MVPGAIVPIGKNVFVQGGTRRQETPGPTFADAMRLFLGSDAERRAIAERLLGIFLARQSQLVVGLAHARRRLDPAKPKERKELNVFDSRAALDALSVFGVLLHAVGSNKETYMNDSAFQLGQLLAGADILHRGYCEHQRGASIPASLLGNQMLAVAQRSPVGALDQLCQRWRVYAGWADKYRSEIVRPKDGSGQGEWAIYAGVWAPLNMRSLCQSLCGKLPENASPRFRAELLLGYIAGLPRPVSGTPGTTIEATNSRESVSED
jgi:hypothetical protein